MYRRRKARYKLDQEEKNLNALYIVAFKCDLFGLKEKLTYGNRPERRRGLAEVLGFPTMGGCDTLRMVNDRRDAPLHEMCVMVRGTKVLELVNYLINDGIATADDISMYAVGEQMKTTVTTHVKMEI